MHTSSRLISENFTYGRMGAHGESDAYGGHEATREDFCPDYHELDRVGVVSPCLEDGVVGAGHALLALTTAFYDELRRQSDDFFDYPQHFAFVGVAQTPGSRHRAEDGIGNGAGEGVVQLQTRSGPVVASMPNVWDAWSWLDVWPQAKWVTALPTAPAMLQRIFDYQINRLFWPADWRQTLGRVENDAPIPAYVWKMLGRSLKTVHLYSVDGSAAQEEGAVEIRVAPPILEVVTESLERLPGDSDELLRVVPVAQRYMPVPVKAFLAQLKEVCA